MRRIVALLDASPAARPVLDTALRVGELFDGDVEAVHVGTTGTSTAETLALRGGVPFRALYGPVEATLLEAIAAPDVMAAVIGTRRTIGGGRPAERTALRIIASVDKPLVVVPPEAVSPRKITRLLVPLDGSQTTSNAVTGSLSQLRAAEVELIVLHVFTESTYPRAIDRPEYDNETLANEFLARHLPYATSIEMRNGSVSRRVIEVSNERDVDLVVLTWAQIMNFRRARVVQEVLGALEIPVLLLPQPVLDSTGPEHAAPTSVPMSDSDHRLRNSPVG